MLKTCNDNQVSSSPVNPSNRITSLERASLHSRRGHFSKGAMKIHVPIPTNARFSRLTVLGYVERNHENRRQVKCRCDCGKIFVTLEKSIKSQRTKSCGCFHLETVRTKAITHGHKAGRHVSSEYATWQCMKNRCLNPKAQGYKNYGGRGIKVCERWLNSFQNFISDMGLKPSTKHTIDRKNNNENYTPKNCRWATKFEQCNNTRKNVRLTLGGITDTISNWSKRLGVPATALYMRHNRGWSDRRILTQPTQY